MKKTHCAAASWQILAFSLISSSLCYANPSNPSVIQGTAQFDTIDTKTLAITTSDKAIINWNEFSIAEGELTQFFQPSSKSVVVNQVTGELSSFLLGSLKANGHVFLLNPNGVLIGENGCVDTNSFIASTLPASNISALLDGQEAVLFQGDSKGTIVNLGRIKAWDGDVALISYQIDNRGAIDALNGTVALAAGQGVLLQPLGSEKIAVRPSSTRYENTDTGINNSGWITACQAELKADGNAYGLAICHAGFIDAVGIAEQNGEVFLVADNGNNAVLGAIAAENADRTGGNVQILGQSITLYQNANIDASGDFGGGTILVGGDQSGSNPAIVNAWSTIIEEGATLYADALKQGDGGTVIVWADGATGFYGEISARGGDNAGDGGFVEVSGKQNLNFRGEVDTRALFGMTGSLLLDPTDITIVPGSTDMDITTGPLTFEPTGCSAQLSVTSLTNALGTNNVTVQTSNTACSLQNGSINISTPISYNSSNSLILNTAGLGFSTGDVNINSGGTITNASPGDITLTASGNIIINDLISTNGGNLSLTSGIDTQINGTGITAGLSGQTISVTATGDVFVTASTSMAEITALNSCSVTSNTGNINVQGIGGPATITGAPTTVTATLGAITVESGDVIGSVTSITSNGNPCIVTALNAITIDSTLSIDPTSTASINSEGFPSQLTLTGGSLIMTAGVANASMLSDETIDVTLTGVSLGGLTMTAGSAGAATIDSINDAITITAADSDMVMTGSSTGGGAAQVITRLSPINITVDSLTMTGGSMANAEIVATSSGAITIAATADIVMSGSTTIGGSSAQINTARNSIDITCNNLTMNGNAASTQILTSEGPLTIMANLAITLNQTSTILIQPVFNAMLTPMLVIAGTDIFIDTNSEISHHSVGPLTLVVDNLFPAVGTSGNGKFTNNGIVAGNISPTRIYTSRRQINSITGTLNGSTFTPGPYLVDSPTEHWFIWYPDPIGGFPEYTILYKTGDILPPPLPSSIPPIQGALTLFNQAAFEFLQDLLDYDVFWYWKTLFSSEYNHAAFAKARRDSQMLSSDLIDNTQYHLLRKSYKEQNGKFINLLK